MKSETWLALAGLAGIVVAVGAALLSLWTELNTASSIATGAYIAGAAGFAFVTTGAKISGTTRMFIVSLGPMPMAILVMLVLTYFGL